MGEGSGRVGEDVEEESRDCEEGESEAVGEERGREREEDASNEQRHHGSLSVQPRSHGRRRHFQFSGESETWLLMTRGGFSRELESSNLSMGLA